ncbi:MAG TPA: glutaredoxin family protein [Xanthomonadales bacterium]|nr:glutaredoxin family protein [Xanthomonadales bacterium]
MRGRAIVALLVLIAVAGGVYSMFLKPKDATPAAQATPAKPTGPVLFYSAPDCEPCDRARTWMTNRGVRFEERDVDAWPPYARELEALGSRIVPVIIVNGEPQYGFFPAYIEAALRGEKIDD